MRAKTEQHVKRWNDQRWGLDSVIQAIGMEWDQPRLRYTLYPCGPDGIGDFQAVSLRVKKFSDMHREFAARRADARARPKNSGKMAVWSPREKAISLRHCFGHRRAGQFSKTTRNRSNTMTE